MPISSAATASSTLWRSASPPVCVAEPCAAVQWPKLRNPMRLGWAEGDGEAGMASG
jgi:hypothetical protein